MNTLFDCPKCDYEFEAELHVDGECPNCHADYVWDFDCNDIESAVYTIEFKKT
jgi:predicted Zn-ribbon and HTH transcriptional regulator